MPAPISVIIPTHNSADLLPDCLGTMFEGLEAGLIRELIISDIGSEDATLKIADAWGAHILDMARDPQNQIKHAVAHAKGEWVMILCPETRLNAGWVDAVREHLPKRTTAWFPLRFDYGGRWIAAFLNQRAAWSKRPHRLHGLLRPKGSGDQRTARALPATIRVNGACLRAEGWMRWIFRNVFGAGRYAAGGSRTKDAKQNTHPTHSN